MFKCVGNVPTGRRIRQRRWMLGMPREDLALAIGITPDALRLFETGLGFMEASRLVDVASALGMPLAELTSGAQRRPAAHEMTATATAPALA